MQYQKWMFNDKEWHHMPQPYLSWNTISWYIIGQYDLEEKTLKESEIRYLDFTFAIMLQKNTGWN